MTKTQIDNLIQFFFLFHPSLDCDWRSQSPSYIKEKWDKYIGINVESYDADMSYFTRHSIDWIKKWSVSNEDWAELKKVIRFIESNCNRPLIKDSGKYKMWTLSEIIENFENKIGPVSQITNLQYSHTHVITKRIIEKWLSNTQNRREYNLSIMLS